MLEKNLANYWGYNSIGFFAPDPRYAAQRDQTLREFKETVARFHDAGIEVILDVVYNHTAEGNERGPTLSFKGVDNASYYRLLPDKSRFYINDTGTGNTLRPKSYARHPDGRGQPALLGNRNACRRLSVRSRHYSCSAKRDGFDNQSGFLKACFQDPVLATVKLIAEPWDCGPGGYQVGAFPPGWAEWNDKFRDTVRDFWEGNASAAAVATRLSAWGDAFNRRGRQPWACVNLITAHDGFTLNDTVTYNEKHNEANGEENRDGSSDNRSWNCGVEGPTDDPGCPTTCGTDRFEIFSRRLLLSQGTPMLVAM